MKILSNSNLKEFNSYRISSTACKIFLPETIEDFQDLFIKEKNNNYSIIGGGNNVILADNNYENVRFVIVSSNFSKSSVDATNNTIEAYSGTSLKSLSVLALEYGLKGLEIFYDIPGTLGGAVWMNAGAYGETFMELVKEVTIINKETKSIETLQSENIERGYRYSQFQDNKSVILSAVLQLETGNKADIEAKMLKYYNIRNEKLPKEYPNAGSVFRRPPDGLTVGEMVEILSLKGKQIGGAQISKKHGGFIVNYENASGNDVLALVDLIKEEILSKYNIELHLEQIVINDNIA
ncbi:MAG: UDP-N-acetylmuramate dehydrogenase [Vampirovibrionia bacterium]